MGSAHSTLSDVDSLVQELERHPVNLNRFFQTFRAQTLSLQQLQLFVRQYHYFCFHFVKLLEGLLYHTPIHKVAMRSALAKTLYSELGSGSPDHAHSRQLERFAGATGLQPRDLQDTTPLPAVTAYLDTLKRLFLHSGHCTALGAELAVETTAVSEFTSFVPGLQRDERFHHRELEFFTSHLAEEQQHSQWLVEAVRQTIKTDADFQQVAAGARETADAWLSFWDGMYQAVFAAHPADSMN